MRKKIISILSIGVVLLFPGCRSTKTVQTVPANIVIEKERVLNKPFEDLWLAAIELFANYNWPVKNMDKSSGFISSDYKLITGNPDDFLYSPPGRAKMVLGKFERVDYGGNFNVLLTKVSEDSTRVRFNIFYDCKEIQYQYSSRGYFVNSTSRIQCQSKGTAEKAFLDYLAMKK